MNSPRGRDGRGTPRGRRSQAGDPLPEEALADPDDPLPVFVQFIRKKGQSTQTQAKIELAPGDMRSRALRTGSCCVIVLLSPNELPAR
jgi:hypothetical protein